MNDFVRWIGSTVIGLVFVFIPGLFVASLALEWDGFFKTLLGIATAGEGALTVLLIYERSEE